MSDTVENNTERDLEKYVDDNVLDDRHAEYFIGGYEVTNAVPEEVVFIQGIDLPLYKRRSRSDVIYAAGYYCVNYETGWKHGSSILLSTLQKYEYRGPFHTKEKAYAVLKEVRKEK